LGQSSLVMGLLLGGPRLAGPARADFGLFSSGDVTGVVDLRSCAVDGERSGLDGGFGQ